MYVTGSKLSQAERDELAALLSGGKHSVRKLKRATVYRTKRRFVLGNLAAAPTRRLAAIAASLSPASAASKICGATLQACEVPIDVINEAKNSLRRVFYLVEAKYLDGFDLSTPRVTQMSRVFGFDRFGGQNLGFTSSHNCSDDDCPK